MPRRSAAPAPLTKDRPRGPLRTASSAGLGSSTASRLVAFALPLTRSRSTVVAIAGSRAVLDGGADVAARDYLGLGHCHRRLYVRRPECRPLRARTARDGGQPVNLDLGAPERRRCCCPDAAAAECSCAPLREATRPNRGTGTSRPPQMNSRWCSSSSSETIGVSPGPGRERGRHLVAQIVADLARTAYESPHTCVGAIEIAQPQRRQVKPGRPSPPYVGRALDAPARHSIRSCTSISAVFSTVNASSCTRVSSARASPAGARGRSRASTRSPARSQAAGAR